MKALTARQIIELLEARGWYESRQSGSHKIFKNWNDPFKHTVVPFHKGKTLPPGTQRAIMRDAGITPDEL